MAGGRVRCVHHLDATALTSRILKCSMSTATLLAGVDLWVSVAVTRWCQFDRQGLQSRPVPTTVGAMKRTLRRDDCGPCGCSLKWPRRQCGATESSPCS